MTSRQAPSGWWGRDQGGERLSLLDLIRNGTLDVRAAALLWLMVENKASIVVGAAPQLAGKTTLLTALVDLVPPWYEKVYTRGRDEDFSFLQTTDPSTTYVLVPELSEHTPAYLWGDGARALFRALEQGYSMAATIHASTPEDVMAMLEGPPLRIHRELLANIHAVVNLRLVYGDSGMLRRVSLLTVQVPDRSPSFFTLAQRDADEILHHAEASKASAALGELLRKPGRELETVLARRCETLESWLKSDPVVADEVRQMIADYYRSEAG